MQVGIASDHGGFALKEELVRRLRAAGHEVMDFGAHAFHEDDDYPDFVIPLGRAVAAGTVERGVAICGSGVGASVAASNSSISPSAWECAPISSPAGMGRATPSRSGAGCPTGAPATTRE